MALLKPNLILNGSFAQPNVQLGVYPGLRIFSHTPPPPLPCDSTECLSSQSCGVKGSEWHTSSVLIISLYFPRQTEQRGSKGKMLDVYINLKEQVEDFFLNNGNSNCECSFCLGKRAYIL